MFLARQPGRGFNVLSVFLGLILLLFWIYAVSRLAPVVTTRNASYMLLLGFGAVFTLFVIRLTCVRPAMVVAGAGGLVASAALLGIVDPQWPGEIRMAAMLAAAVTVAAPTYRLASRTIPKRVGLRGEELAVIYTILVIGTATAMISRSALHGAANLWREEYQLAKWIPPHFLPAWQARDDIPGIAYGATAANERSAAGGDVSGVAGDGAAGFKSPETVSAGAVRAGYAEKGAMRGLFEGQARVPWWSWFVSGFGKGRAVAEWTFPAIFWMILILTFEFFFLFVALVYRRRWIEEERLPFPMAQLPLSIIGRERDGSGHWLRADRARWIAFAIGFALTLSAVLSVSPTGSKTIEPLSSLFFDGLRTRHDLTGGSVIPAAMSIVWLAPLALVVMLFVPIDVLMTALVTFLGVRVGLVWLLRLFEVQGTTVAARIMTGTQFGAAAGLAFWTLVFHYKEIERLLRSFARGTKSLTDGGVVSLRNFFLVFWLLSMAWAAWVYPRIYGTELAPAVRWLMLAGTFLLFLYFILSSRRARSDPDDAGPIGARNLLLLLAVTGLSFTALTLPGRSIGLLAASSGIIFVYAFSSMRVRGETVTQEFDPYPQGRVDVAVQARYVPGPSDPELGIGHEGNRWWNTPPGVLSQFYGWHFGAYFKRWAPHNHFLDTFKIGHETGASARDILRAVVLAMVVAAVLTPILTLATSYKYGFGGNNTPMYWYQDYVTATGRVYIFGTSSMEPPVHFDVSKIYHWPVVAFFVIGAMMYMRREYVWFPFHPVGLLLGAWSIQQFGSNFDMWFTLLVAFLIKRQIFRWFGVRFFQEKVQPVLAFAAMGLVLGIILFILRFAVELGVGIFKFS